MVISELFKKFGSDKCISHSYQIFYDPFFKGLGEENPIDLLEIGIQYGSSLMAWKEYFPNGRIVGIDKVDVRRWKRPDVEFIITDVKNYTPDRQFDVIVDDGSHKPEDMVHSMLRLTKYLKPRGTMFIEDFHEDFVIPALEGLKKLEGKFITEVMDLSRFQNNPYDRLIIIQSCL